MKVLVVLSGGQDSTTCLFYAINKYGRDNIKTITFHYGQRHRQEVLSAIKIAQLAGVNHEVIEVHNVLKGTSPLINKAHEVEQYESVEALPGGLEKTFVPSRNMLFLTIASNRAYVLGCEKIIIGVSQEDFGGYPDCRLPFIEAMETAINEGLDSLFFIEAPLIHLNKKQTVEMAEQLGSECLQALSHSHTCYNGVCPPCGKCHACLLRAKGFEEAGIADPIFQSGDY